MNLNELRKQIDTIDKKMVELLNKRAKASQTIGKIKLKNKKGMYAPDREKEVLKKVKGLNTGPMSAEACEAIYREIMSCSLALEKIKEVAYLGNKGSFTYSAAFYNFRSQVNYTGCASILEVFQKVENGECDYGVVPVENSTEGGVTHTLDLLVDSELKICSQVVIPISHTLMGKSKNLKTIKKIYSNPQVFGQCRNWLFARMPNAGQIWVPSTTQAAQLAKTESNSAAIGSELAAEEYGLKIIQKNIQDIAHNTTRFLIIAKEDVPATGKDRTSILFSIKDKVGALHAMLIPFQKNRINLTKIESRPSKKKAWDYFFFVDFEGHRTDKNVQKALSQLEDLCKYLKILGSYPV